MSTDSENDIIQSGARWVGEQSAEVLGAAREGFNNAGDGSASPAIVKQQPAAEKAFDIKELLAEKLGFGSFQELITGLLDKFLGNFGGNDLISGLFNQSSGANTLLANNESAPQPDPPGGTTLS